MMFFVHPQIKLNKRIFSAFLKSADLDSLKKNLSLYFPNKQFVFTDMGRTAFKIIIEQLKLENSEIIFPAYICDIFYPILKKYNIKPIFVDIELDSFNININKVLEKITPNTKAVLVSHTYGFPVDMEKIEEIKGLTIIEDCAHSFGAKHKARFVGNFGDASFFSLYKQFPSLRGGMLVCPEDWHVEINETNFSFRDFISFLNSFPFFAFLFKSFGSGVAPKLVRKEKNLEPAGINRISLNLFSQYLEDFEKQLEKRKKLALLFQKELEKLGFKTQASENNVFCYISALMPKRLEEKRDIFVNKLKKQRIFCTRIWHTPIIMNPEVQKEYDINLNEFPNTVEASKRIINLPLQNHYTEKDIKLMSEIIEKTIKKL
ncbi:MAG: DegT/DnrJ/EryC1/StrS family aminotransferase [Candidatus Nealsonbacteria bacterium]